jgi:hypothetical protein
MSTVFKCSRCGYENTEFQAFKKHLSRKTECKPKVSDIAFDEVKKQFDHLKRKKMRDFGDENTDAIVKDKLKEYVEDPLRGVQQVIRDLYFTKGFTENHTIRLPPEDPRCIEVHIDNAWIKRDKKKTYDKMIYRAQAILEYNVPKKIWTNEFKKFLNSMEEMDNDDLLELIREEIDDTIINAEKELSKNETV